MRGIVATAVAILIGATAFPAIADDGISVGSGDNEFNAGLGTIDGQSITGSTTSAATTSDAPQPTYVEEPVCVRGEGAPYAFYGCGGEQACGTTGTLYNVWAIYPDGSSSLAGINCRDVSEAAPAEALTPGRILEAFRKIPVPTSPIGVNPVGGRTLVNFDTIFHTEARPFTETVRLLGRSVTFDITPSEFTWKPGQGGEFTTTDPGREYRPGLPMSAYVTHRYLEAGKVQLGLDTTWTARWRVGNGPWRPVDGTVTTTSTPVPLEVVTARPQLISYD